MRNLKRTLSLLLAAAMLIGMMVVSASAVSYSDFSDSEEIVNKDAVSMLTTLGVINGKEDGSYFDPTGNVTRAEMAKMISVMLSNNEDCDQLYMSVNSGLTDITNSWARGYINYCYTLDIIAGRGNGTFDPTANVTAVEAAKMLLTALGYDPAIEGLVGTDWDLNTASLAHQLGVFRHFTKDVNQPLNRDDAALLIYNAMDVEMIQQYQNGYALAYADHRTVLSSVFGVIRVEGVVVGNEWARLEETDSDAALRTGKTTLDNVVWYDSTTANTVVDEGVRETQPVTFNVTTPVEYIGKAVTMYVEKTTILSNSKVVGVATNDELNVIVSTVDGADKANDLLDGTGVELNNNTDYYVNYGYCENQAEAIDIIGNEDYNVDHNVFALNGIEVQVIDNDDDGFAEYVLYTAETLSQVIRYNTRDEVVSFYESDLGTDRLYDSNTPKAVYVDFEDVVIAEGDELAADDLILYNQYGGRTYISLAPIVTGTMTRLDRDEARELYITIDNGDEYYQSYIRDNASDVDVDVEEFDIASSKTRDDAPGFDTLFDFILDSHGFIVAIRPAEEVVTNYALVLDSAWTLNGLRRGGTIEILMADGTTGTYDIDWNDSEDAMAGITYIDGDPVPANADESDLLELYLGTRDVEQTQNNNSYGTGKAKGSLIAYSLDEDDVLTIERVFQQNEHAQDDLDIEDDPNMVDLTSTAGVGDNGRIVYMDPAAYLSAAGVDDGSHTDETEDFYTHVQYKLAEAYSNGSGSITIEGNNSWIDGAQPKTYAVDRNTLAFYYWTEDGKTHYSVATGWNEMSSVAKGTHVQVYPVLTKTNTGTYQASNLAGVILFEAETSVDNDNYLLVLSRNAYTTGNTLWLNVVFEDGTVDEIEVDSLPNGVKFNSTNDFMKAYAYVQNSDGTYDLENAGTNVYQQNNGGLYADLLRVGTVAYGIGAGSTDTTSSYVAYTEGTANVWDVTGVEDENDEVNTGSFRQNVEVHAVIVEDDNAIRTAWIWDVKENPSTPNTPATVEMTGNFTATRIAGGGVEVVLNSVNGTANWNTWTLGAPTVTYTIYRDGRQVDQYTTRISTGNVSASTVTDPQKLPVAGYFETSGRYTIEVAINFNGTSATDIANGTTYVVTGECTVPLY